MGDDVLQCHEIPRRVFAALHFRIDYSRVLALRINVMHLITTVLVGRCTRRKVLADLSSKSSLRDGRIEDMIDVNGKNLQESNLSSSGDCVGSVVRVGPSIGTVGEATVSKVVYDALVRILF